MRERFTVKVVLNEKMDQITGFDVSFYGDRVGLALFKQRLESGEFTVQVFQDKEIEVEL